MPRVVICYDVADDRRRTRLHTLLCSYGEPVEESVIEVVAGRAKLAELRAAVLKLMEVDSDIVRFYPLCRHCERGIDVVVGPAPRRRSSIYVV